jgi:uncharacterized protein (TIGR02145 family)
MKIAILVFIAIVSLSSFGFAQSVTIGTQTWTTKNLDVATFRNGDAIPQAKTFKEWKDAGNNKQPAWCYYDDDAKNGTKYGTLYNWYAVNDARGLAPAGWHIPTDEEWTVLSTFLGGGDVAGKKMKMPPVFGPNLISYVDQGGYYAQNWVACSNCQVASSEYKKICPSCKGMGGRNVQGNYIPKTKRKVETQGENIGWDGDNSSGFSGLPGGQRNGSRNYLEDYNYCAFSSVGNDGNWWSASEYSESAAWVESAAWGRRFVNDYSFLVRGINWKSLGLSVRCVRD